MELSVRYNNAGARFLKAGRLNSAWTLLKGALEVRRLAEINQLPTHNRAQYDAESINRYVRRAEHAYQRYVDEEGAAPAPSQNAHNARDASMSSRPRQPLQTSPAAFTDYAPDDAISSLFYTPFLYQKPMILAEGSGSSEDSKFNSAAIIFNLTLTDHIQNKTSSKVLSLYNLALKLIGGQPIDELSVALINNIGVWYCDNGDMDGALYCMSHLSQLLRCCDSCTLGDDDRGGLLSNVLWLVHPPCAASPAA